MEEPEKLFQKALVFFSKNDWQSTINCLLKVLIKTKEAESKYYDLLGSAYYYKSDYREAVNFYLKALKKDKNNPFLENKIGAAFEQMGDLIKAERYYLSAYEKEPEQAMINYNLGSLYQQLEKYEKSIDFFLKAEQVPEKKADCFFKLGFSYQKLEKFSEALVNYQKAITLKTDFSFAYYNICLIYLKKKDNEQAIFFQKKALEIEPKNYIYLSNLCSIYFNCGEIEEAAKEAEKASEVWPENPLNNYYKGLISQNLGKYDLALNEFQRAVKKEPTNNRYRYSLAVNFLIKGNFQDGWQELEFRFGLKEFKVKFIRKKNYREYSWKEGKRIFVYSEQGFGDTFMFVRYLSLLKKQGKYVIFECQNGLKNLLKNSAVADEIYEISENSEEFSDFDVSVPLLSLPYLFHPEIPNQLPYLKAEPLISQNWQKKIKKFNGLKVGFAWEPSAKSTTHWKRSLPLKYFIQLSNLPDLKFFSLQKGAKKDLLPADSPFIDFSSSIESFSDTAALIDNLDLVISIDTSVAHLSAAMGKETFILLPFSPDWRWSPLLKVNPWYPEAKLFRQEKLNNWDSVFSEIKKALLKKSKNRVVFSILPILVEVLPEILIWFLPSLPANLVAVLFLL